MPVIITSGSGKLLATGIKAALFSCEAAWSESASVICSFSSASFRISGSAMLTLEKTDAPFLEHAGAATTWRFNTADLKGLLERMDCGGYELKPDPSGEFWRGTDPEGNVFLVCGERKAEED